jgi:hypothetical protein
VASIRAFVLGIAAKGALSLVSGLMKKNMWKQPLELLKRSLDKSTWNFGFFLFFFVLCWKGIRALISRAMGKQHPMGSFIAGGAAGLSLIFFRNDELPAFCLFKVNKENDEMNEKRFWSHKREKTQGTGWLGQLLQGKGSD